MKQSSTSKDKGRPRWKKNPLVPIKKKKIRYVEPEDYLLKKRQAREKMEEDGQVQYEPHSWNKVVKDMTATEKARYLVEQSKKLEMDVEQKEQKMRNQLGTDKKAAKQCNDMLFDAISAKLALLDSYGPEE